MRAAVRRTAAVTSVITLLASGAVLLGGFVISWQAASMLRADRQTKSAMLVDQRAALSRTAVETEVHRYLDALRAIAASLGGYDPLTPDKFQASTSALPGANLRGATSVAFMVPASDRRVADVQRVWRERGNPTLTLTPIGTGHEHFFAVMSRRLDGGPRSQLGLDVSQSAEPAGALNEARRAGGPAVSDTYVLLRDRRLPKAQQQLSFALTTPVYGPANEFLGWVTMGLHGQDFMGETLHDVTQGVVDASLWAPNGNGQTVRVASLHRIARPDLFRSTSITVANRAWRLETAAASRALPVSRNANVVGIGGAVITVLLAGLVWVLATGRARATAKVSIATRDLRTAQLAASRQVGLLNGILERISDGVGVVDERGEFIIHNPAAKAMMGVDDDVGGGGGAWPGHYGIFRPDGTTPFPAGELPLVRAIAGEFSEEVEVVIRNATHPDGILLSVNCRPFQIGEQRGAIAVFHDITTVRDREADLRAFAGIVAHDLKNPLAVISAHAEMAQDAITDGNDHDAMDSVVAVSGAVVRMRRLIDDLLAYTATRDAQLKMATVDLFALVTEVVEARVEHLPARPDIYIGPLPHVTADPTMLLHLLDNLIGNALKYVQPGRTPRIDISATSTIATQDSWVRVEIADRGIGIPDVDKPHVFESFHRAPGGADYVGTGLGLAICRRIIDRHGGTIGVSDNPGGGSRFAFTLPVATSPPNPPPETPRDSSWQAVGQVTAAASSAHP